MQNKANISNDVKRVLSSANWNQNTGTVKSLEVLKLIKAGDKQLSKVIQDKNLVNIKHKTIPLDVLISNSLKEAESGLNYEVSLDHLLLGVLKTLASKKYSAVKKELISNRSKQKYQKVSKSKKIPQISLEEELEAIGLIKRLKPLNDQLVSFPELEKNMLVTLSRKDKKSIIITASPGGGKSSLVYLLVNRLFKGDVPTKLKKAEVIQVNLALLSSDILSNSELMKKFSEFLLERSLKPSHSIILFDNIHYIPSFNMYSLLPPAIDSLYDSNSRTNKTSMYKGLYSSKNSLYQGSKTIDKHFDSSARSNNISFIVTLNNDYIDRFIDNSLLDTWEHVDISKVSKSKLYSILVSKKEHYEKYHHVTITTPAIKAIHKYVTSSTSDQGIWVQSAFRLLDTICASLVNEKGDKRYSNSQYKNTVCNNAKETKTKKVSISNDSLVNISTSKCTLTKTYVLSVIQSSIAIKSPIYSDVDFSSRIKILEKALCSSIIGQQQAIKSLIDALTLSTLGLKEKHKPIYSSLFLGPTGVGKTQTAKCLAENLYSKDSLLRLDMSDFMEKHTLSRLVGSPPGYVGYGEGGQLVDFIMEKDSGVILFDEVEKAHPEVLNVLLSILEEGEITSGDGEIVKLNNFVIILTSNLGADLIHKQEIGFVNDTYTIKNKLIEDRLKENLKKKIKPEILNRLQDIIVFNVLNVSDAKKIAKKSLDEYLNLVSLNHGVSISYSNSVIDYIVKNSYSKEYGVREIKRGIEKNIMSKVAKKILLRGTSTKKMSLCVRNGAVTLR